MPRYISAESSYLSVGKIKRIRGMTHLLIGKTYFKVTKKFKQQHLISNNSLSKKLLFTYSCTPQLVNCGCSGAAEPTQLWCQSLITRLYLLVFAMVLVSGVILAATKYVMYFHRGKSWFCCSCQWQFYSWLQCSECFNLSYKFYLLLYKIWVPPTPS